jgi:hypothetical protein
MTHETSGGGRRGFRETYPVGVLEEGSKVLRDTRFTVTSNNIQRDVAKGPAGVSEGGQISAHLDHSWNADMPRS